MNTRGLGHIPDAACDVEDDLRCRHVGQLVGASPASAWVSVDYSSLVDGIPDQGSSNSCVGQAFATALYLRAKIAGHPIARPSAKAIYDLARLTDTVHVLSDDGCRPRAAIDGMTEHGLVAAERWPLTGANVNELPPLDVFRAGLGAILGSYYRIGGGDVSTLVRLALSKGFVPVFAMDVDPAYLAYSGGTYERITGARVGAHMQAIVGCDADSFLVSNSWGSRWGVGGFGRIATDFFNTSAVRDVLVVTTTPLKVS